MNPTPQQLAAVLSSSPLTFVIAGAGAGKTKTLIWRVEHLVDAGAEPQNIVAITFTNAGAKEMEKRLGAIGIRIGYVGTLHSFMLRLLRAHHTVVGYKPMINVLDEEESEAFRVKIESDLKYNGTQTALDAAIAAGPPQATERLSKERLVAAHYYKALKSANLMTFDSILIYGLKVCQHLKNSPMLNWSNYYLIDEVQDSSAIDFKIYGALVGDRFFAGDTDQAIYSFRGGEVALSLNLATVAKVFLLEDNFRCGSRICDAAQRLIENNRSRYPKETRSATGFPGAVEVRSYSDPSIEAAGIANTIATSDMARNDIAVLVRTNDLVKEYANHLRSVGISVAERVFKERPADFGKAKRLLAFLNNPDDDYIAERWLDVHVEAQQVSQIKSAAAAAFKTINQFHFKIKPPVPLEAVGQEVLNHCSAETWGHLIGPFSDLPDGSTIADLILAIGSQETGEDIGDGVTVTTIHGAKGREWGVVFLPAFEQQTIPGVRKSMDIEEERRLAYVAFTRAKQSLIISHSRVRVQKFGRLTAEVVSPSQFIAEAGLGAACE